MQCKNIQCLQKKELQFAKRICCAFKNLTDHGCDRMIVGFTTTYAFSARILKTKTSTMVKNVKEALNKQGNILMLTWKENMNMNTLLNLGGLRLESWCLTPLSTIFQIQHYVNKFVSDLQQVSGFLWVFHFSPPMKLTTI
jgi:hypothetical protein